MQVEIGFGLLSIVLVTFWRLSGAGPLISAFSSRTAKVHMIAASLVGPSEPVPRAPATSGAGQISIDRRRFATTLLCSVVAASVALIGLAAIPIVTGLALVSLSIAGLSYIAFHTIEASVRDWTIKTSVIATCTAIVALAFMLAAPPVALGIVIGATALSTICIISIGVIDVRQRFAMLSSVASSQFSTLDITVTSCVQRASGFTTRMFATTHGALSRISLIVADVHLDRATNDTDGTAHAPGARPQFRGLVGAT